MSTDPFDLAALTDEALVESFRRTKRDAAYDKAGASLILACIYRGREAAARALVAAGHRTGLHESAAFGDTAGLATLIDQAPWSVDLLSPDGWTALHLTAFFGRADAARLLLARGAGADVWARSFERNLPLHAAAAGRYDDMATLEILIPATTDIDAIQDGGYSPLLIAASVGKRAWVERLIAAGADPNRRTKDGKGLDDLAPNP